MNNPFNFFDKISEYNAAKLADDPEFTKTEYFTPNHSDHFCSNSIVNLSFVNFGLVSNHDINFFMSLISIVSLTNFISFDIVQC